MWGCLNDCEYCYARGIAKRFGGQIAEMNGISPEYIKSFKPSWIESNFDKEFPKKPSRIFVNSMSGIEYWFKSWTKSVLEKIREHPQHTFIFLTKNTMVYRRWTASFGKLPDNCWFGITAEDQAAARCAILKFYTNHSNMFLNIEPILSEINLLDVPGSQWGSKKISWVIVGGQTGPGSEPADLDWVRKIRDDCKKNEIPFFFKNIGGRTKCDILDGLTHHEFPEVR